MLGIVQYLQGKKWYVFFYGICSTLKSVATVFHVI